MNTMQEMLLSMLRNPLFKLFLLSPTLRYLVKKLQVDLISPFLRGSTGREVVIDVGKKIRDQWKLVTFARIRFYRGLAHDELITERQLERLVQKAEKTKDALLRTFETEISPVYGGHNPIEDQSAIVILPSAQDELRMVVSIMYRKPVPLPWERDPDFFEKHPTHKRALLDIQQREHEIAWYDTLWNAMVDGLR